jgi:hypothetical protein
MRTDATPCYENTGMSVTASYSPRAAYHVISFSSLMARIAKEGNQALQSPLNYRRRPIRHFIGRIVVSACLRVAVDAPTPDLHPVVLICSLRPSTRGEGRCRYHVNSTPCRSPANVQNIIIVGRFRRLYVVYTGSNYDVLVRPVWDLVGIRPITSPKRLTTTFELRKCHPW